MNFLHFSNTLSDCSACRKILASDSKDAYMSRVKNRVQEKGPYVSWKVRVTWMEESFIITITIMQHFLLHFWDYVSKIKIIIMLLPKCAKLFLFFVTMVLSAIFFSCLYGWICYNDISEKIIMVEFAIVCVNLACG